MIYIAWVISLVAVFFLGYELRRVKDAIKIIQAKLTEKPEPEESPQDEKAVVVDPLDPIEQAKAQREELIKNINPEYDL